VAYIFEDLHSGRSIVPPHRILAKSHLVRWDTSRPLSVENTVVLSASDIRRLEAAGGIGERVVRWNGNAGAGISKMKIASEAPKGHKLHLHFWPFGASEAIFIFVLLIHWGGCREWTSDDQARSSTAGGGSSENGTIDLV
jgi:hypothetical protein